MNPNLSTGIPLIGAPTLSDLPKLPDEALSTYLPVMEQMVAQGARLTDPVQIEFLVLASALRDLRDLRAAVAKLDPIYSEDAQALLPSVSSQQTAKIRGQL